MKGCVAHLSGQTTVLGRRLAHRSRLLQLYQWRGFNELKLLASDLTLEYDELGSWQAAGGVFLALYTVGIPLAFFGCLWVAARPTRATEQQKQIGGQKRPTQATSVRMQTRHMARYGLLYAKYDPRCWWWEEVELLRKLLLTGVVVFVSPGSTVQIWFAVIVALTALLCTTYFTPYANDKIDAVSWAAQTCTLLTLLCTLALKVGFTELDGPFITLCR